MSHLLVLATLSKPLHLYQVEAVISDAHLKLKKPSEFGPSHHTLYCAHMICLADFRRQRPKRYHRVMHSIFTTVTCAILNLPCVFSQANICLHSALAIPSLRCRNQARRTLLIGIKHPMSSYHKDTQRNRYIVPHSCIILYLLHLDSSLWYTAMI